MWNWIVQNKQWVFSGVGILIITALWGIVKRVVRREPSSLPASQPTSNSVVQAPVITVAPVINLPHQAAAPQEPKLDTTDAFEIIFDPENPGRQFWSHRTIENFSSRTHGIEYRVKIRNRTQRTLHQVKATTETFGPMGAPQPQTSLIFDLTGQDTFTLDPGASVFVKLFFTSLPLTQPGTLMGSSTAAYGPLKVTVSALDTRAVEKVFRFTPLRMDFNPEKESLIY